MAEGFLFARRWARAVVAASMALAACEVGAPLPASPDGGAAGEPDPDVLVDGADSSSELVEVSHRREVRGTWIATVSRINWPSSTSAAAQRAELVAILDAAQRAGINTIFLQVRPEADALYDSELEPWSRYLTGTQGGDPGYDPLAFAIEECHRRGLELHAWLNPYRARAGSVGTSAPDHVINAMPEAVVEYGTLRWLDPGHPDAFDHTLAVIRDLLTRYDFDGLHFDDYFYPYPQDGLAFDDDATYALYGGGLSRGDWRRNNVNRMVEAVGAAVQELRPDVRWGISPFGIYRPGMPEGVVGLDQYAVLYADPVRWMSEGWLEYVAPQLYWPTTSSGQPYEALLSWWADRAAESGRTLLVGNAASRAYGLPEYRAEMDAMRAAEDRNVRGAIWWSVGPIVANDDGLADMLAAEYYATPAATPALADATGPAPAAPALDVSAGTITIATPPDGLRYWAVYRASGPTWDLDRLVPATEAELALPDGLWAISAIDRQGLESLGVRVQVDGAPPPDDPGDPAGASCLHSYGGTYADRACSRSYQCCDGTWRDRGACGDCACVEETGEVGCGN